MDLNFALLILSLTIIVCIFASITIVAIMYQQPEVANRAIESLSELSQNIVKRLL